MVWAETLGGEVVRLRSHGRGGVALGGRRLGMGGGGWGRGPVDGAGRL